MKLIISLLVMLCCTGAGTGTAIKIVTEHFPPYQFVEDGKIVGGLSVEIVNELLDETGIEAEFFAYPWARAYRTALHGENILIFSITRNEEREPLFKWVGPITGSKDYFWSLKDRNDVDLNSLEDAKQYAIGVPRDDNQYQFLKHNGFNNLLITPSFESALKMLYANRIDLVMGAEIPIAYMLKNPDLNYLKLEKKYEIGQKWGDLSIAFGMNTSDELVHKFRLALERIRNDGTREKIIRKWISEDF